MRSITHCHAIKSVNSQGKINFVKLKHFDVYKLVIALFY